MRTTKFVVALRDKESKLMTEVQQHAAAAESAGQRLALVRELLKEALAAPKRPKGKRGVAPAPTDNSATTTTA